MLRYFICFQLFTWVSLSSSSLFAASQSMEAVGARCTLGDSVKIFLAKDGDASSDMLKSGTIVVLKVEHEDRWMVETMSGQLGFINTGILTNACWYSEPAYASPTLGKATPDLRDADVVDTVKALEIAKSAAQGKGVSQEALDEQRVQVEKVAQARAAARARDHMPESSGLIRVAVYDLDLSNIPQGLGNTTTEALLQEVRKLEGVSAIGMDEVREMLDFEAQRRVLGCEADNECLAEIAGALGVDELLIGTLSEQADGRMMVLKRVDQRRAEVKWTFDKRLKVGSGEEFLLAVGNAIQTLFPERTNRPGTTRGVSDKVVLRLNPPPVSSWITYATFGLTAVAASITGISYLQGEAASQRIDNLESESETIPFNVWNTEYESYQNWRTVNRVGLYSGGGLLLTSLVMSFFTDWEGYGEGDPDDE